MVRPFLPGVEARKDEILAKYHAGVSQEDIVVWIYSQGVDISSTTLRRRLDAWTQGASRRRFLTAAEEDTLKTRIRALVHEHFLKDAQIFETLRAEGHYICSVRKVRELRQAAGISRWTPTAQSAAYNAQLVEAVRRKLDEGVVVGNGARDLYASLRVEGIIVPHQRLGPILRQLGRRGVPKPGSRRRMGEMLAQAGAPEKLREMQTPGGRTTAKRARTKAQELGNAEGGSEDVGSKQRAGTVLVDPNLS